MGCNDRGAWAWGGGDFQWGLTIGCEDEGFESENGVDNCFTQMRVGFVFLLI